MRIVRHCKERLPGGTRLWQRVAKEAGFTGTLKVTGNPLSLRPDCAVIGLTELPGPIRVVVPHSPCSTPKRWGEAAEDFNPLVVFGHELYHWRRAQNGYAHTSKYSISDYRKDIEERRADQYAYRLIKKVLNA